MNMDKEEEEQEEAEQMQEEEEIEEARRLATTFKELGNQAFRSSVSDDRGLDMALHYYTEALVRDTLDDSLTATLYSNCAAVFFKMGQWAHALKSAKAALDYDPGNAKALYRAGKAAQELGDVMQAARFCDRALKLCTRDQGVRALQESLIALYSEQADRDPN